jgi:hypothetical protein
MRLLEQRPAVWRAVLRFADRSWILCTVPVDHSPEPITAADIRVDHVGRDSPILAVARP